MKENQDSFWESDDTMSEEEARDIMNKIPSAPQTEEQEELVTDGFGRLEIETVSELEEEESNTELLTNARLRLEQGRLYEMLLNHNLFEGVDADKKAISNVQKEIRTFIKERLEVLVGLKPDPKLIPKTQALPFNSLEIDLLKKVLSKMTKGATEQPDAAPPAPAPTQQKLSPIKPQAPQKLNSVSAKPAPRPQPAPQAKTTKQTEANNSPLTKSPYEMTAQELRDRNKQIAERQAAKKAAPTKKMAMPDAEQMTKHYASQQVQNIPSDGLIGRVIQKLHGNVQAIETVSPDFTGSEGDERI